MKNKISLIVIITLIAFVPVVSNASSINLSETKIDSTPSEEFQISIDLQDILDIEEGINAYQGKIEYDKNIFEEIKSSDIKPSGEWMGLVYNSDNGIFVMERKTKSYENEKICTIRLQVKKDITKTGIYKVKITNNIISGGKKDIVLKDKTLSVNIKLTDKNEENKNQIDTLKPISTNIIQNKGVIELPYTGIRINIIVIFIIGGIIFSVVSYKKYKKLKF